MSSTGIVPQYESQIWVSFQKEGIHSYPAAKDIEGVEFLANPHRHMFHFKVTIDVYHDDRDIEFILFKRELQQLFIEDGQCDIDHKSCEMLAKDVLEYLFVTYPGRNAQVSVSEDGENGAVVSSTYNHK